MESARIGKRIAAIAAELADLTAEPFDTLTTAERLALAGEHESAKTAAPNGSRRPNWIRARRG